MNIDTENPMNFEVVICGAGLIGLSLAKALDKAGIKCALIEQRSLNVDLSQLQDSYSNRVSAITHQSQQWLEEVGAWEKIKPYSCAYENMYVYDGEGTANISFKAAQVPCDNLGHIVENIRMIDALNNIPANIELFENTKVIAVSNSLRDDVNKNQYREISLDNGQTITCQLVIGADSKQSTIRELAKLNTSSWSYDQTAIVATVKVKKSESLASYSFKEENNCWQNFTFCGPLAFLPLYSKNKDDDKDFQYYSIVWSVDSEHLDYILGKPLIDQLTLHAPDLGQIIEVSESAQFELTALHCHEYTKEGLAILGDAAHSIHPLAGQGANLGFADAKALFEIIIKAKENDLNLGNSVLLKRYERERKTANKIMQGTMEGFKRGFKGQNPIQVLLRNTAMNATNHPLFPKSWVINQALK